LGWHYIREQVVFAYVAAAVAAGLAQWVSGPHKDVHVTAFFPKHKDGAYMSHRSSLWSRRGWISSGVV